MHCPYAPLSAPADASWERRKTKLTVYISAHIFPVDEFLPRHLLRVRDSSRVFHCKVTYQHLRRKVNRRRGCNLQHTLRKVRCLKPPRPLENDNETDAYFCRPGLYFIFTVEKYKNGLDV